MFDHIFTKRTPDMAKLTAYGFTRAGSCLTYTTSILEGMFNLTVTVDEEGRVNTDLTDRETGEAYTLHLSPAAQGSFVGDVRHAIEEVLTDIADTCFTGTNYRTRQGQLVADYALSAYGSPTEHLWAKYPEYGIWRRQETGKWYGIIMVVGKDRLGFDSQEEVEILNLHLKGEQMPALMEQEHYYPGWHMNKKYWYTVILDNGVSDEELLARVDESYRLAKK